MITINLAETTETFTYHYNADTDMFGSPDSRVSPGFEATHVVIVDNTLFAQEIDSIFDSLFK